MSQKSFLFKFFIENNCNTKISMQQLYSVYIILRKHNSLTFSKFCVYAHFFKTILKQTNDTHLFLCFIFFFKTQTIKDLCVVNYITGVTFIGNVITANYMKTSFSGFWDKFKKLKRPVTDLPYSDYYISSYKSKLIKYSAFGFLVLYDSLYVIRSNSNMFLKNLVKINKPLLIIPKYASSSINKYLPLDSTQSFEFQFLRKNKVYNKGRYSRCRQNYRTGVYMCMYLSVVSIFGLYYSFYKFSFNFTYLWWIFISFIGSFFLPKIIKYRLYEPITLISKFFSFFKWFSLLVKSILK